MHDIPALLDSLPVQGKLLDHQRDSVGWMLDRELNQGSGGILADDMGLGKTHAVAALLCGNRVDSYRSTLIVTLKSCRDQWLEVLSGFGSMRVVLVTSGHMSPLPRNSDVVLTTYPVFRQGLVPPCINQRDWARIVLDEGHEIRSPGTRAAQNLSNLIRHRQFRWILTGTPVQNDERELDSLFAWVGCREGEEARAKCMLRRTVSQVVDRYPKSFRLPPIHTKVRYLFFRYSEERRLYFRLVPPASGMQGVAERLQGGNTRGGGWALQDILHQRQLCFHPEVMYDGQGPSAAEVADRKEEPNNKGHGDPRRFCTADPQYDHCQLAGQEPSALYQLQLEQLRAVKQDLNEDLCPLPHPSMLRVKPTVDDDALLGGDDGDRSESSCEADLQDMSDLDDVSKCAKFLTDPPCTAMSRIPGSTKLDYLCNKLMADFARRRKVLVFCQWKREMQLIAARLAELGVPYSQLDGDLNQAQRSAAIYNFQHTDITVMIIQIRAGGVGLNLQAASRVYITSPDWNPVVELQAIARAHRINQTKPVRCVRMVMAGTIEELSCMEKERHKLDMIIRCLKDDDFSARRMGVNEAGYQAAARVCLHYRMLERLRFVADHPC